MMRLTGEKHKKAGAKYSFIAGSGAYAHEISDGFIDDLKDKLVEAGWQTVGDHVRAFFGMEVTDIPYHTVVGINTTSISTGERYEFVHPGETVLHPGATAVEVNEGTPIESRLTKLAAAITADGHRYDSYGIPWGFYTQANPTFPGITQLFIYTGDNNEYITTFSILGTVAPIGGKDGSLPVASSAYSVGGGWIIQSDTAGSPRVTLKIVTSYLNDFIDIISIADDVKWEGLHPGSVYGWGLIANQYQFMLFAPGCVQKFTFFIASSMYPESPYGLMYINGPSATGGGMRNQGLNSIHGGGEGLWMQKDNSGFTIIGGTRTPEFVIPTNAAGELPGDSVRNDIISSLIVNPNLKAYYSEPFLDAWDDRGKRSISGCFWDSCLINYSQDPITFDLGPADYPGQLTEEQQAYYDQYHSRWYIYPKDEISMTGDLSAGRGIIMFGQPGTGLQAKGMFVAWVKDE